VVADGSDIEGHVVVRRAVVSKKPITGLVIGLTDIALDLTAGFSVWDE
jgi:hypothetical protein